MIYITCVYLSIPDYYSDLIISLKVGKYGLLNSSGKELVRADYDAIVVLEIPKERYGATNTTNDPFFDCIDT